jgi:transcription antitermination factor NusB|tara:strand:- start:484 stop:939 length:456 start_codon:yes stop_codon:yes gene_type:complete
MSNKLNLKSSSRYAAIQALYGFNFSNNLDNIEKYLLNNNDFILFFDFGSRINKKNFSKKFLLEILETFNDKKDTIDELIISNLENNWTIERLPKVLLAILRVAISEMIFSKNISIGIIVSEYLMFTESFYTEKECSFANAILEKIFLILRK